MRAPVLLLVIVFWVPMASAQIDELKRADALIREGRPQPALELLAPLAQREAGNAEYHYLAGIAAIDAGEFDRAVSSLKEALRIRPGLVQARAELGRVYLLTGNYLSAHATFDEVRRSNPPPEVLASIDRFVEGVHGQVNTGRKRFRGSVSVGFGHDSNVNSATSAQQVTLPILGGIVATLSPSGRAQADSFSTLGAEVSGFVPLSDATGIHASGGVQAKLNSKVDTFDYLTANAVGGLRHDFGANQVGASLALDTVSLDNQRVRDSTGVNLEWRRIVHPLAEISAFAQFSKLDYPRDPFRDAKREVFGIAINPVAFGKRLFNLPPVASVYAGTERPTAARVEHLGYRLLGGRSTLVHLLNSRTAIFAGISYERREYGGPDPLFLATRLDRQFDLGAGVSYGLSKDWTLLPALSYTENNSNLDVFKYRRTAASLSLRYSF